MTDDDDYGDSDYYEPLHGDCHYCGTCENWCHDCKADNPLSNLLGYTVVPGTKKTHFAAVWDVGVATISIQPLCNGMGVCRVEVGTQDYDTDHWSEEWEIEMSILKDAYVVGDTAMAVLGTVGEAQLCWPCERHVRRGDIPVQR